MNLQIIATFLIMGCLFVSCGGGGESNNSTEQPDESVSFRSSCGVIANGELVEYPNTEYLELVTVAATSIDTVIATRVSGEQSGQQQLVRLLGIGGHGISTKYLSNGKNLIEELASPHAYLLIPAKEGSSYELPSGEAGIYGQLFSLDGINISEQLLERGYASPEVDGIFSDQLTSCYDGLKLSKERGKSFRSTCGVINAGRLENPVYLSHLEAATINVLSANLAVATIDEGPNKGKKIGIVLHGVGTKEVPSELVVMGREYLSELTADGAYLLRPGSDCIYTSPDGGQAMLAQLFTLDGININEELITVGAVVPENNGCSARALQACYESILVETPTMPTPDPDQNNTNDGYYPDTAIDDFLWKPVSESTGNLVVLLNVKDAVVKVKGAVSEQLVNTGPSNGRGTTARASRSGCAFGKNIKVEVFDRNGQRILVKDGSKSISIQNGCDRVEWKM